MRRVQYLLSDIYCFLILPLLWRVIAMITGTCIIACVAMLDMYVSINVTPVLNWYILAGVTTFILIPATILLYRLCSRELSER